MHIWYIAPGRCCRVVGFGCVHTCSRWRFDGGRLEAPVLLPVLLNCSCHVTQPWHTAAPAAHVPSATRWTTPYTVVLWCWCFASTTSAGMRHIFPQATAEVSKVRTDRPGVTATATLTQCSLPASQISAAKHCLFGTACMSHAGPVSARRPPPPPPLGPALAGMQSTYTHYRMHAAVRSHGRGSHNHGANGNWIVAPVMLPARGPPPTAWPASGCCRRRWAQRIRRSCTQPLMPGRATPSTPAAPYVTHTWDPPPLGPHTLQLGTHAHAAHGPCPMPLRAANMLWPHPDQMLALRPAHLTSRPRLRCITCYPYLPT